MKISEKLIRESFNSGELSRELPVFVFDSIGSTNDEAKRFAEENTATRAIFLASSQTNGRGRRGRSFISPEGGLYLSILIRPSSHIKDAVCVTSYTAVIVRRAIEELTGLSASIKWVNDITVNQKKLSGILTEGKTRPDGTLEYCVVGIGINVHGTHLNDEIKDIATTLEIEGYTVSREALAARISELFFTEYEKSGTKEIADEYRRACPLIGKSVTVMKLSESYPALVEGITDSCELVLRLGSGECEILSTGEVSIRVI